MNAQRLRGVIQFLVSKEADLKIQDHLAKYREAVAALAGAPADAARQTALVQALSSLEGQVESLTRGLTPAQMKDIAEVRAYDFFSGDIIRRIKDAVQQNGMTPAVLDKEISQFVTERQQYLERLSQILAGLDAVGIQVEPLAEGEVELEVMFPRSLFENDLGNFQEELKILYRMIRTFSEIANITPGTIQIKQISTSDPTLFLGVDVTTLVLMGIAIRWGIDLIKSTIEIKRLVTSARSVGIEQDLVSALDGQIKKKVESAIAEKAKELLADFRGNEGRKNVLKTTVENSLDLLLQRIERGMTLEIRLLPPPKPAEDAPAEAQTKYQEFERLAELAKSLEFPKLEGQPALQLTRQEENPASEQSKAE